MSRVKSRAVFLLCALISAMVLASEPREAVLRVWIAATFDLHIKMADDWIETTDEGKPRTSNVLTLKITTSQPKQFFLHVVATPKYSATAKELGKIKGFVTEWSKANGSGKVLSLAGPHVKGWYYVQTPGSGRDPDYVNGYFGYLAVDGLLPVKFSIRYNPGAKAAAAKALEAMRTAYGT
jgi:hypothetical protein